MAGAVVLAVLAASVLVFSQDDPYNRSRIWIDYVVLAVLPFECLIVGYFVGRVRSRDQMHVLIVGLAMWIATPAWIAITLWDNQNSARNWLGTAWYWMVDPVPLEVQDPFSWSPTIVELQPVESAFMVGAQLVTVSLLFGTLKLALNVLRQRSKDSV